LPTPPARSHFHDEYELLLITATSGKAFVGDGIGPVQPGHPVLCGACLLHDRISMDVPEPDCRRAASRGSSAVPRAYLYRLHRSHPHQARAPAADGHGPPGDARLLRGSFNNMANFNRGFPEIKGVTPGEFRRQADHRFGGGRA
jgi:hypothetical protein